MSAPRVRARTFPPRAVPCYLGLLVVCLAAALRWRLPAALALWAVSAGTAVLVASALGVRALPAIARDLGHLLDGLRRRDVRALWSWPVASRAELEERLPAAVRDWTLLAAGLSLTLLALAGLSR